MTFNFCSVLKPDLLDGYSYHKHRQNQYSSVPRIPVFRKGYQDRCPQSRTHITVSHLMPYHLESKIIQ